MTRENLGVVYVGVFHRIGFASFTSPLSREVRLAVGVIYVHRHFPARLPEKVT